MTASTAGDSSGSGSRYGCLWFLAGPVLAVAGTAAGAALIRWRWSDCPRGMDRATQASMVLSLPIALIGMTVALALLQGVLAAVLPEETEPEVKWVALLVVAVVLFLLYVFGMGSPDTGPGGTCYRGAAR
ncbi:hypothetical protein [Kitasatospora sp. NPDC096204]|uniref:hypothetical protein n=1 Tax=Kitasatospora sp. NPDC096204 TaxID=3364094 RepID=UPI0038207D14